MLITLLCYYSLGTAMERQWGTLKFNLFYLSGVVLMDYLGIDTEVLEYHNSTLFTFNRRSESEDANIAVVAGNRKRGHGALKKLVVLRFLMYHGDVVYQKDL